MHIGFLLPLDLLYALLVFLNANLVVVDGNASLLSHKYWASKEFPFCSKVNQAEG
jgi:hypothetical protein